jgi:hypothetical protein
LEHSVCAAEVTEKPGATGTVTVNSPAAVPVLTVRLRFGTRTPATVVTRAMERPKGSLKSVRSSGLVIP